LQIESDYENINTEWAGKPILRLIVVGEILSSDPEGTFNATVSCHTSQLIAGKCLKIDHDYFVKHSALYLGF
jgi:hypothetical protein